MNIIKYVGMSLILIVISNDAMARNYSGTNPTTTIYNGDSQGVASAMIDCHYDYSKSLQGCLGVASFDGNDALGAGIGQRVGNMLISGKITTEAGKQGIVGVLNWHF